MNNTRSNPSVVIIGAGMTGIGVAIKLQKAGITDITLLEKAGSVGGTWRENTYPGVACDVPSHAYTYSFEPNPGWSSLFAGGAEIRAYFERIFLKYGLDKHTHFDQGVSQCEYRDGQWQVLTESGDSYTADLLFSATGFLHQPVMPDIAGLNDFAGPAMHSARWNHSVDMKGKRIGVIGTGSSATQIIPELIDMPGTDVSVFQRTPNWIVHTENTAYSEQDKQRFAEKPSRIERVRKLWLSVFELGTAALTSENPFLRLVHRMYRWNSVRNLKKHVKDPELRAKLTPDYAFGCKRVVLNGSFYDAIQKPNAQLVTEGIDHIEADGIVTRDGQKHELDVLVLATGFDATAYVRPINIIGRDGLSLSQAWSQKISAYRSLCLPGFPNYFMMLGPNSPVGNYSVIDISEKQADYAIALIKQWQAGALDPIEVKPEALADWRSWLKKRLGKTIWASGCQSWYLDADGDPMTWPDSWKSWVSMMNDLHLDHFINDTAANKSPAALSASYPVTES